MRADRFSSSSRPACAHASPTRERSTRCRTVASCSFSDSSANRLSTGHARPGCASSRPAGEAANAWASTALSDRRRCSSCGVAWAGPTNATSRARRRFWPPNQTMPPRPHRAAFMRRERRVRQHRVELRQDPAHLLRRARDGLRVVRLVGDVEQREPPEFPHEQLALGEVVRALPCGCVVQRGLEPLHLLAHASGYRIGRSGEQQRPAKKRSCR